jgi:hypothetical protein
MAVQSEHSRRSAAFEDLSHSILSDLVLGRARNHQGRDGPLGGSKPRERELAVGTLLLPAALRDFAAAGKVEAQSRVRGRSRCAPALDVARQRALLQVDAERAVKRGNEWEKLVPTIAPEPSTPSNVPAYSSEPENGGEPVASSCAMSMVALRLCLAAWAGVAQATVSATTATTQKARLMTYE